MKSLRQVQTTRKQYHVDPKRRTVHRSSLLVPHVPGCTPILSFVNHFLLKRNYPNVACKIMAIDASGNLADSITEPVTEPRAYSIELERKFGFAAHNYVVEFHCADNLFIPFPAAMINHSDARFCNVVHSYNRVLNDVFEDDDINRKVVDEASIDVVNDAATETFFVFSSGIAPVEAPLHIELSVDGKRYAAEFPVHMDRLSNRIIGISQVFPGLETLQGGVIRIRQPKQPMFFGRLLAGVRSKSGVAFSANHSFYDSSTAPEYWQGDTSSRTYPFFSGFRNAIRMYPIMSPGRLDLSVEFSGPDGTVRTLEAGSVLSPSDRFAEIDVNALLEAAGAGQTASYRVLARAAEGGAPTRITHQLVISDAAGQSPMQASLAVGLNNPEAFAPPNRRGYTWGQMAVGSSYASKIGLVWDSPDGEADDVELEFYSAAGKIAAMTLRLQPRGAILLAQGDLPASLRARPLDFIWFIAKSRRADLNAYSVHRNMASGHCSGEHGF